MIESDSDLTVLSSPQIVRLRNTITLGVFIVAAAVSHAAISSRTVATSKPLYVGTVFGEIHISEREGVISHHKCDGCRIECYESFVVVYVDRTKVPNWTGNYVLPSPWSKIAHLTLADPTIDQNRG